MKLDLGSKHTIDKLVLVGRRDCCPEQSSNWTIRIGSTGTESDPVCKDEVDASGGRPKHVFCKKGGPTSGQWVSIWSGTWMVLCEIEVYGSKGDDAVTAGTPGQWDEEPCSEEKPFVCQGIALSPPPSRAPATIQITACRAAQVTFAGSTTPALIMSW